MYTMTILPIGRTAGVLDRSTPPLNKIIKIWDTI